ncbi:unnamed protein product, partial [Didymodactylos carnosus]
IDIVCDKKSVKPIALYESFFQIIGECRSRISHGGRNKTLKEIQANYNWTPHAFVDIFMKQGVECQIRKSIKTPVVSRPIISVGVMAKVQIDLVDMRSRPDAVSNDVIYSWILHCKDHFSKYTWAVALKAKSAEEVVLHLRTIFFTFGPCRILHSDNGKEFVNSKLQSILRLRVAEYYNLKRNYVVSGRNIIFTRVLQ